MSVEFLYTTDSDPDLVIEAAFGELTEWGEAHVQRRDRLGGVVHEYVLAA